MMYPESKLTFPSIASQPTDTPSKAVCSSLGIIFRICRGSARPISHPKAMYFVFPKPPPKTVTPARTAAAAINLFMFLLAAEACPSGRCS